VPAVLIYYLHVYRSTCVRDVCLRMRMRVSTCACICVSCTHARPCLWVSRACVWICVQARAFNTITLSRTNSHASICVCMLMYTVRMSEWGASTDCVLISCPGSSTWRATQSVHCLWTCFLNNHRLSECTSPHAFRNSPPLFHVLRRAASRLLGP